MAFINPQIQIDQQQNARNDRNLAAIGQGFTNFADSFEVNRRRAIDEDKARKAQKLGFMKDGATEEVADKAVNGDLSGMQLLYTDTKKKADTKASKEAEAIQAGIDEKKAKAKYYEKKGIGGSGSGENLTYEEKLDLKAKKDAEVKAQERQDPIYKLEKLGAEGRSKVGAIASGIQALDQMHIAGIDGHGPARVDANTPLIGAMVSDTPYTEGERTVAEVIGRLQSGGAMNDTEIKTFKSLGPRPGDDAESKRRKLQQQKDFLANKLTAFGLKNNDLDTLGFETRSKYVPAKFQGQDAEAFQWARQNSGNPKAQEIMKRLGVN